MTTWTPVEPTWAVPSVSEIADLHWLAYRAFRDLSTSSAGGAAAAVAWVRGGRVAPVTERDEVPATRELAESELWAAHAAGSTDRSLPLELICSELGVPYRPPLDVDRDWARGAAAVLRWLTKPGAEAPMPLPVRHADGSIPTAQELYDLAVATAPGRFRQPEDRAALRQRVDANARRYRELADLVEDTKRRVAAA